ncbi:MAG: ScyD/ScyE family protein, partial [Rhodothermales bacterium]
LRSVLYERSPVSAYHLTFHGGALWASYGIPTDPEGHVLRIDTTGFRPGDTPFTEGDAELIDIESFILAQGFPESNIYNLRFEGDDLYVVDAAANAVIKRDGSTGELSVYATLDDIPNPTPVGPPFIDAVPTSIVADGERIFVANYTGFPFASGLASIFGLGTGGDVSVVHDGLTLITDLAIDPRDGNFVVLQFGEFGQQGPVPGTGRLLKLQEGRVDTLAAGLSFVSGLAIDANGDMFVSSLMTGDVVKIQTTAGPGQSIVSGLTTPLGIEMDARGNLWVAEQGTGNGDGQISVIAPDGEAHPFITGLRSILYEGSPVSAYHIAFYDGSLWAAVGLSPESEGGYLLRVDTSGFRPGDPPLTANDAQRIDVGSFMLGEGFAETNLYDLTFDTDGNLYAVDAAANAVIKRDAATGALSVFARLDPLPNPTPVGPPFIQAVPTSILFDEDRLFVG